MIKLSITALLLASSLTAGNLSFDSGMIKAHTEVFGDNTIDPMVKKAQSRLSMDDKADSLHGVIEVNAAELFSDNAKRDEHMHEVLESGAIPKISFDIKEMVAKGGDKYTLKGALSLHGVTKPISFEGSVSEAGGKVHIVAKSSLKMTDFGIKPIKMMFLTVRDQVDLNVDISLKR
ncbi:MAG: YceI family protein [Sulfuricurvum sp.]|uniref:YceI family protein n=1 Tax=Sulfuricurvum sp. TaxID=2025608 RepID=UPI0026114667|nr:YceI family protein [Sulfuricurvum sp.]MDD2828078.1 YceI family protein [Sulfuricurvum sp.]MDD4948048.1 YceI family protein [Sulfuricurvum sp.]